MYLGKYKKICTVLGWNQKISFETGISEMLNNIDEWRDAPLWDEKSIEGATKKWFEYLGNN